MDGDQFLFEVNDGVGVLTFNRPDRLNALTFDIYESFRQLTASLSENESVRALVLTGNGAGFCSGGDVHDIIGPLLSMNDEELLEFTRMTCDCVKNLRRMPQPVIAALNGVTAGAGAVLALACDLRIAARSATIAYLFTKVGLTGADMGAGYLLPRVVGFGKAAELLLLGNKVDAETAERIGLVNLVVEDGEALPAAMKWAQRLADGPIEAVQMTKHLIEEEWTMTLEEALTQEAEGQAKLLAGEDMRRFHDAFTKKERPRFSGQLAKEQSKKDS